MRKVVITGIGLITPIGLSTEESWKKCVSGSSGIGPVTRFPVDQYPTRIAGEIKGFDVSKYFEPKEARRFDLFNHYAVGAALDALRDSKLEITLANAERVGVIIGSGIGGVITISETAISVSTNGPRYITPFFIP